jgi:hypothetical protein
MFVGALLAAGTTIYVYSKVFVDESEDVKLAADTRPAVKTCERQTWPYYNDDCLDEAARLSVPEVSEALGVTASSNVVSATAAKSSSERSGPSGSLLAETGRRAMLIAVNGLPQQSNQKILTAVTPDAAPVRVHGRRAVGKARGRHDR